MGDNQSRYSSPPLNVRDCDFYPSVEWVQYMKRDMAETVALTKKTIATTKALMAEIDRIYPGIDSP